MRWKKRKVCALMLVTLVNLSAYGQANDMTQLFTVFSARAAAGKPDSFYEPETEAVMERFEQADKQSIDEAFPAIIRGASSSFVSVRRLSAMDIFLIAGTQEGRTLLSPQTPVLGALLIDSDIQVRRLVGFALANLHLDCSSPLLTNLTAYLLRDDAVATIGAGVAGVLMMLAPDDTASSAAVVHFMQRKDQTPECRAGVLQSIRVSKSHNREIGKAVADYAADPDDKTSVRAIETIQVMGKDVVLDNEQSLSRIAADLRRTQTVRAAATKAVGSLGP